MTEVRKELFNDFVGFEVLDIICTVLESFQNLQMKFLFLQFQFNNKLKILKSTNCLNLIQNFQQYLFLISKAPLLNKHTTI